MKILIIYSLSGETTARFTFRTAAWKINTNPKLKNKITETNYLPIPEIVLKFVSESLTYSVIDILGDH